MDASGGAGGVTAGHTGAAEGGDRPTGGQGGRGPTAGESSHGPAEAEGGASGEGGAAGSSAGNGDDEPFTPKFFPAADEYAFWDCKQTADEGFAGAGGAPSWPLPSAEATLSQLVGDWAHNGAIENSGDIDYFHFDADGSGSQVTVTITDDPEQWTVTYAGTIELADHEITLDSTTGTSDYSEYRVGTGKSFSSHRDLPQQVLRYGYSYDETTDTLYVNSAACSEPVPFARFEP